jgi:hypothetical protein
MSVNQNYRNHYLPSLVRLRHSGSQKYLHFSAEKDICGIQFAWLGTREQAVALRERITTERGSFPYEIEGRKVGEGIKEVKA